MAFYGRFTKTTTTRTTTLGLNAMTLFFIFYAVVSMGCVILWGEYGFTPGLAIGIGIFAYGLAYFMVHDIFIHQRFKIWRNANNRYARGVRRAHKIHHKHLDKAKGECFGMLWVPLKYFK
jgi:beta-carotene 3-hydroxylase